MPPERTAVYWSFAIVPVQEWISEARRSRDLWAGSRILSWLMALVLRELDSRGATVIVPKPPEEGWSKLGSQGFSEALNEPYSIPNRASGSFAGSPDSVVSLFERLGQETLQDAWKALAEEALDDHSLIGRGRSRAWSNAWAMLKDDLSAAQCPLSLVWCISRVDGTEKEGLAEIDKIFLSVKRSRPVSASRGAPVGKCSQCGKREAAGPNSWHPWRSFHRKLERVPEVRLGYRFEPGERLCPVCAVKRLAGYLVRTPFPSTSEIASRPWTACLDDSGNLQDDELLDSAREAYSRLRKLAKEVPGFENDPYPLLYSATVDRLLLEAKTNDEGKSPDLIERRTRLQYVNDAQISLASALAESGRLTPERCGYLAVLVFDGDNMGARLKQHPEATSSKLNQFAERTSQWLHGETYAQEFYLGGDEGLILLPVHDCLQFARSLRSIWKTVMGTEEDDIPTLSAGMTLFHRESPLSAAVEAAHRGLNLRAKSSDGKDALSVTVQTASGSAWNAVDHWDAGWERCAAAVEMIQQGRLASGWAYDVEGFLRSLDPRVWTDQLSRDAVRTEVRRLTARRIPQAEEDREKLLSQVWQELQGERWWSEQPRSQIALLEADRMHLVAFLGRQMTIPQVD